MKNVCTIECETDINGNISISKNGKLQYTDMKSVTYENHRVQKCYYENGLDAYAVLYKAGSRKPIKFIAWYPFEKDGIQQVKTFGYYNEKGKQSGWWYFRDENNTLFMRNKSGDTRNPTDEEKNNFDKEFMKFKNIN
ncbi:MAG: hypothetical protein LBO74_00275 [Candidatus Symbiothrix sp.]|jgi:hypothetical protein|nr:hypothetical protein [Candidatus Symbiothrix sp.]